MKNAFLIDVMKININYIIQIVAVQYRVLDINLELVTFDEHVTV
jgi:hypothetical protein